MPRILFAAVALLFAASVAAQAYRWVDKDGKVHYSQIPPSPAQAASVERKSAGGSTVEAASQPYATRQAAKNHPVTIYTAENCKDTCGDARALLAQRGVPFREVAITDEKTRAELKKVSGSDEVPVLAVGRQVTKGFATETWHTALDSAGYPRSAPPLAAKAQKHAAEPAAKADAPQQAAAAAPTVPQPAGRYAPPPPDADEAKRAAEQAARTAGRYAPPAAVVDPKAPPAPAQGPYAPK
ncbi:MAG TPA: glutaredoxin family protein [Burkholderiales bacterium]|nr:glutaredoxin family protein [Burkholderiales bacterium]